MKRHLSRIDFAAERLAKASDAAKRFTDEQHIVANGEMLPVRFDAPDDGSLPVAEMEVMRSRLRAAMPASPELLKSASESIRKVLANSNLPIDEQKDVLQEMLEKEQRAQLLNDSEFVSSSREDLQEMLNQTTQKSTNLPQHQRWIRPAHGRHAFATGGREFNMVALRDDALRLFQATGKPHDLEVIDIYALARTFFLRMNTPLDQIGLGVVVGLITWARSGFPTIALGTKRASKWAAMTLPPEHVADLAWPWQSFMIRLPVGLIEIASSEDDTIAEPVEALHVAVVPPGILITREGGTDVGIIVTLHGIRGTQVSRRAPPLRLADAAEIVADEHQDDILPMTTLDERALILATRIVIGAVIEMDRKEHKEKRETEQSSHPSGGRSNKRGQPVLWAFQFKDDIDVDCREWVRSYMRGDAKELALQTMVRGHHKRQRCGPRGEQRKWIAIEPYWRGPEDAPIAVRSHRVEDT